MLCVHALCMFMCGYVVYMYRMPISLWGGEVGGEVVLQSKGVALGVQPCVAACMKTSALLCGCIFFVLQGQGVLPC